ncbi:MAG: hypothetical protein C5B59_01325 [Bacteroidetes bacterium]|nr:MAG: hypothetical protein C5B59_01325 [Bacteroidota bacterium]
MNWRLIFQLSLFGLAMAFATVYWIPSRIEPFFWLVIFIFCAYQIATKCSGHYFLNGFMVSIFNCVWITGVHIFLYHTYRANHPEMDSMTSRMPMPNHPRLFMLLVGPLFGISFGIVLGLFSSVASRLVRKKAI